MKRSKRNDTANTVLNDLSAPFMAGSEIRWGLPAYFVESGLLDFYRRPTCADFTREIWEKILADSDGYPILRADLVPTSDRKAPFDARTYPCPYCSERHLHGPIHGHRNSHCGKGTYYLVIIGLPYTPENL